MRDGVQPDGSHRIFPANNTLAQTDTAGKYKLSIEPGTYYVSAGGRLGSLNELFDITGLAVTSGPISGVPRNGQPRPEAYLTTLHPTVAGRARGDEGGGRRAVRAL
jgi:hypothetical protein